MDKIASEILRLAKEITSHEQEKTAKEIKSGRASWLPKDAKMKAPRGTDLEIYYFQSIDGTQPAAAAFSGKKSKPDWIFKFKDEGRRDKHIKDYVDNRKRQIAEKVKKMEEHKKFKHGLKVGDILYSSWGYEQTNINFYQVTKTTDKSVNIREVASKIVKSTSYEDYVVPVKNKFIGNEMKNKRVHPSGYVKIDSVQSGAKWDGRPKGQTSLGARG